MARQAIDYSQVTKELLDQGVTFRVRLPFGTFTIQARPTLSGAYWLAYKGVHRKMYRTYIGSAGSVKPDDVREACTRLARKTGLLEEEEPETG